MPSEDYQRRKADREAVVAQRDRVHVRLGNAKVATFLAACAYLAIMLGHNPSSTVISALAAIFVALSVWHEVVMRALARAKAAVEYYDRGIARIEDRWMSDTPSGDRFRDRDHPYSEDLDLFGPRSLFQLLSTCRTPLGESRLASWLLRSSAVSAVRLRQQHVDSLRGRVDLRERLATIRAGRRLDIHPERLIGWAESPRTLPAVRMVAILLSLACVVALAVYLTGGSGVPVVAALVANVACLAVLMKRAKGCRRRRSRRRLMSSPRSFARSNRNCRVIRSLEHWSSR